MSTDKLTTSLAWRLIGEAFLRTETQEVALYDTQTREIAVDGLCNAISVLYRLGMITEPQVKAMGDEVRLMMNTANRRVYLVHPQDFFEADSQYEPMNWYHGPHSNLAIKRRIRGVVALLLAEVSDDNE